MPIRRKPIKILSPHQSNRLLVYKPPRIRLIIPEEVVMQPCFRIIILVLQSEGVICTIRYLGFLFQSAPDGVVGEPNQIVVLIGNLFREADFGRSGVGLLVAFTFFVGPIVYLYQGFVAVGIGVDIGISAVRANALVTTV